MRVHPRTTSTGGVLPAVEVDPLLDAEPAPLSAAFRWLDSNRAETVEHPLLRPIVGRDLHRRIFQDVIQKRAVPLLRRLAIAQGELRGESAERARDRTRALLERLKTFDRGKLDNPDAFFDEVGSLSRDIDKIIDDANYAVFGMVGTLHQLKALNVALRSSQLLWHSIRMGHAMREPALQTDALKLGVEAQHVFDRGWRGDDITADLKQLEDHFGGFKQELDAQMGRDSGLAPGLDGLRVSRRVWSYRSKLELAILRRERREGGHLDNRELCAWVRKNGIPPEVVQEILREDVLPVLYAIAEEPARTHAAQELQKKARALIDRIENVDPDGLRTADQIEAFAIEIGRSLDQILAEAEEIAKPADKIVHRLRESRAAADAIRVLLLTLRVSETAQDTSFTARAQRLLHQAETITDGPSNELEQRLADLERDLTDLGDETKRRLHVEHVPFLDKSLGVIQSARKAMRLRAAAGMALNPEVRHAVDAFNDLEMPSSQRREIYDRALGKPLLDTVVGLLLAMREVDLGFTFADVGRGVERFLRAGGGEGDVNPLIAKSPLAFLARAEFESTFGTFDKFLENAGTPKRRKAIDASLNVVRAVASVERDALGDVAARIPEGQGMMVAASTVEWLIRSTEVLLEWAAKELAAPSGVASADFLELMVAATETHLDSLIGKDPKQLDRDDFLGLRHGIHDSAGLHAKHVGYARAPDAFHALTDTSIDGNYADRLSGINDRLLARLEEVETTDASRKAMHHILRDLGATMRTVVNLVHLFGAASNDNMDPDERARAIQGSVERMGPLFVKLMQTLANMQTLLAKLSPEFEIKEDDPLFSSLKKLQDEVTPLPWEYIEGQIRSSLELGDGPLSEEEGRPAPFVTIDREPLKAGSIGQTHRCRIRVGRDGAGVPARQEGRDGREEIVDAVVKVLRPDIDKTFEDTIRITRLTMLVFKELLRLDVNASIFGEVKPQAERVLALLERALEGFIESFRVETNFQQEAANMRAFKSMLASDRSVVVPEVFDSHTKGNILTMEEIKGFKLSKWIERHRRAEAAPKLAEDCGPIASSREAIERARLFVEQSYAATPLEARVDSQQGGRTNVRVRFSDYAGRTLEQAIDVHPNGGIRLDGGPPINRRGAERKASIWGERMFGLPVRSALGEHVEESGFLAKKYDGYRVKLAFESPFDETAEVFVDRSSGMLAPRSEVPDLTTKGLETVRDRLTTTFGVQVARGLLHGDPHEGNFFVLPDGKTIGLIDYGLAIDMGMFDAAGPLMLLSAAFFQSPRRMAEAMLGMSTQADLPQGPERDAIIEQLTEEYDRILRSVADEAKQKQSELSAKPFFARMKAKVTNRFDRAIDVSKRALELVIRTAALAPSAKHLQALKATFSMGGNLAQLEKEGLGTPKWKRGLRLFKNITLQLALAPFAGHRARKQRSAEIQRIAPVQPLSQTQLERLQHTIQSRAPD